MNIFLLHSPKQASGLSFYTFEKAHRYSAKPNNNSKITKTKIIMNICLYKQQCK